VLKRDTVALNKPIRWWPVVRTVVACGLLLAAGAAIDHSGVPWYRLRSLRENGSVSDYDPSAGFPPVEPKRVADTAPDGDRAVEMRKAVIGRDAAAIEAQCRRAAGGDWEKWDRDTAEYRAQLRAKIEGLRKRPEVRGLPEGGDIEPLEGRNGFPLFEVAAREHLAYLFDPDRLDAFRKERPPVAAARWLKKHFNIDLIFVVVPKMTEVHIEHFLDPCPEDGIIAPAARKALLELLKEDVEVVDGFTLFRARRDADAEYLFNTADNHWAPRGMRVMAKEIADRIERYRFGTSARYALPVVRTVVGPYKVDRCVGGFGSKIGWQTLTEEQRDRARQVQTTNVSEVVMQADGAQPPNDPHSPVLMIAHSYGFYFADQLIKELNMLIDSHIAVNTTTQFFNDFVRDPEGLGHARVIVWVTTEQNMTRFGSLPAPITAEMGAR
jgi:hypothetical protein